MMQSYLLNYISQIGTSIIIHCSRITMITIIFIINAIVNFFILQIHKDNYIKYIYTLITSYLTYIVPYLFFSGMNNPLFMLCFSNMIITDIFENTILTIIPYLLIIFGQTILLLNYTFTYSIKIIFLVILIFYFFKTLNYYSRKYLKQDGIGEGDILMFCALVYFFSIITIIFSIILSSFIAVLYAIVYYIFMKKKVSRIPYIPFLYLGISLILEQNIYNFFLSLFNIYS